MSRIITLTKNRNHKDTIQQMSTKQKDPCPALFPIPNEEPYKASVTISPKQRAEGALISNIKGFRNAWSSHNWLRLILPRHKGRI